jgi:methylase of polypeptide subunit release factors
MNAAVSPGLAVTEALVTVGRWLQATGYAFTTVTPATHARVNARPESGLARTLRDVFGWSRPFVPGLLPQDVLETLRTAQLVADEAGGLLRSRVRFSSLHGGLYAHSGYPTTDEDAVFFGPDTVRFADLVLAELGREPLRASPRILDLGCGGGPGGIVAARACEALQPRLVLADINPKALRFAAANAALAGMAHVAFAQGDLFGALQGEFDLIVSNPPYLNDAAERTYRHGGGQFGEGLSERIVREGLTRLSPGGRLVLYTGAAIVEGHDPLRDSLAPTLDLRGWPWRYRELDPDVFGEELLEPAYAGAERIAAVALVVQRPA